MHEKTGRLVGLVRNGLAVVGLAAVGFWLGSSTSVRAAAGGEAQFQLTNVEQGSALLVYEPSANTVYVYRGATQGNSTVQCSFKFVLGKAGGAIQRENCPVGNAF